jgi:hypothetical protein
MAATTQPKGKTMANSKTATTDMAGAAAIFGIEPRIVPHINELLWSREKDGDGKVPPCAKAQWKVTAVEKARADREAKFAKPKKAEAKADEPKREPIPRNEPASEPVSESATTEAAVA